MPFKDAEKARECKRRYRDRNRELLRAKGREYQQRRYAKDDEYAEWQRNYQRRRLEEEPEVIRERDRRSYEKHAVERREKSKRWREQNPVHFRVLRANGAHRRRVRIAGVKSESIDRVVVWIRDRGRCHICGLRTDLLKFHLDHVVPIAKGGDHTYSNVAVSHPSCNLAKGSKLMSEVR